MNGSLQEQLLKSGLVNEDRLKESKTVSKIPAKKKRKPSASSWQKQQEMRDIQETKKASDNFPTPDELKKQKELRIEVKKMLRSHKLNDKSGEIAYNYTVNKQVKRFFVTPDQQKTLIAGSLAIANWNEISYLIPIEIIDQLRNLYPKIDICLTTEQQNEIDKNDPYADYVIPDDIKW